jgi:hypothetical protein
MKLRKLSLLLTALVIGASAARAMAITVDVCINANTDARFDTTGHFFTGSAPVYPSGTLAVSGTPIDCTSVTVTPIGTFFTNGGVVAGLPASEANDVALVTWHFRVGNRAFDTIGPVKSVPAGGTYPQTVVGATGGLSTSNNQATVTALDSTGFVFEITAPSH